MELWKIGIAIIGLGYLIGLILMWIIEDE